MHDVLGELVGEIESDPSSLGLILHGSRAMNDERADSDYDLIRIVTDEAYERRKVDGALLERRESQDRPKPDILYQSPSRLHWLAENPGWWTATYATARVIVDKTGDIESRVHAIVERGGDFAYANVGESYDSYLNSFVRSLKSWRRGDELGGRLHAAHATRSSCVSSDAGCRTSTHSPRTSPRSKRLRDGKPAHCALRFSNSSETVRRRFSSDWRLASKPCSLREVSSTTGVMTSSR